MHSLARRTWQAVRRCTAAALVATAVLAASASAAATPRPHAVAWLVFAPGHGGMLVAHDVDDERPVASLTKLMTAHLVLQGGDLGRIVVARRDATTVGESVVPLRLGERQTARNLLQALVVRSANDSAVALADAYGGSEAAFVRQMNAEARRLGLRHTGYRTPYGLDTPGQYSSARDVLALAMLDMRSPVFRRFADERVAVIPGHVLPTRNSLLGVYAGLDGVKTGHTDLAGWNLAASAVRGPVRLYAVVLGSPSQAQRDADVARLLDWGFDRFRDVPLVRRGASYGQLPGPWGTAPVGVVAARSVVRLARPSERFSERVMLPDHAPLPLRRGQQVGTLELREGRRLVGVVPLVAARSQKAPGLVQRGRWLLSRALDSVF
jgi:D-alanyl-D-alanine carboxypeptidase (penicillin-binding protein 5/6)